MYDDEATVLAFIKERVQADVKANSSRHARDRADLQALMMYRGGEENHWTVWDPTAQTYVPRPTGGRDEAALPEWFFRATTNLFANKIDGITAIHNQSKPAQEISPARDDDRSRACAEVAEAALPALYDEAQYEALRAQIHKLVALTNGIALHVYYDTDERWGMEPLQLAQCASCQQFFLPHDVEEGAPCPECGQGPVSLAFDPQSQMPVGMDVPRGKLSLRLLSSFEFSVPRSARELHEERVGWIAGHGRMDPTEVIAMWSHARDHIGPRRGTTRGGLSESAAYADQMRGLSGPGGASDHMSPGGSAAAPSGPVIWMVWADPVDDDDFYFPDGLYAAVLEDTFVLDAGPLPFRDHAGRPVKNVLLRTYQATPGSAWGKPPSDDLVPLQKQLNLAQALAFLILMNEAAPTTWVPDTVTLLDDLTGMPGATVRYQALRAGDKPVTTPGAGFPEALKWFLEFLIQQFDVVSKLNAVLEGKRPEGDPTLGEVQILTEQGMSAFKEPLDQLVDFEKRLSLLFLRIARHSMWAPRFYTVQGDNGEWEVKQFLGADLDGEVTIHVEPASAWPASQLLTNLRLDQAFERGLLNPADPEVQETYLTLNNLSDFKQSSSKDRKQIARQLDAWKMASSPQEITPPDPLWNLPLHFFHKLLWLRTEEAELLASERPDLYAAMRTHVLQIQQLMLPPPAPAPTGPDGSRVDAAVASGALRPVDPATAGAPDGSRLDAAVASGALRPAGSGAADVAYGAMTGTDRGPNLAQLLAQRAQRHGAEARS